MSQVPYTVKVEINRDLLLRLIGWIEAHRPPGDWEPGFLSIVLRGLEQAVELEGDTDD